MEHKSTYLTTYISLGEKTVDPSPLISLALALQCSISLGKNTNGAIGTDGYVEIEVGDDSRRIRIATLSCVKNVESGIVHIQIETKLDFEFPEEVTLYKKRLQQIIRYIDIEGEELDSRTNHLSYTKVPIVITSELLHSLSSHMPELPVDRKHRYLSLGLHLEQADLLVDDKARGDWFDRAVEAIPDTDNKNMVVQEIIRWMHTDISIHMKKAKKSFDVCPLSPEDLVYLIHLIKKNEISGSIAKKVIQKICASTFFL